MRNGNGPKKRIRVVSMISREPVFCKVFSERNYETLEKNMGAWLKKEKPILRDTQLAVSSMVDNTGTFPEVVHKYTVLVFYRVRESA